MKADDMQVGDIIQIDHLRDGKWWDLSPLTWSSDFFHAVRMVEGTHPDWSPKCAYRVIRRSADGETVVFA